MHIGFNKYQVYGKIVVLTFILAFVGFFIYFHPPLKFDDPPPSLVILILLPIVGLLILVMALLMALQLFFLPNGVTLDNADKSITLNFLLSKSLKIEVMEIEKYGFIWVNTGSSGFEGIMLHLENGKKYLLGDFNLREYLPIQSFLEESNVQFTGKEKFSFFSYFINTLSN
jgi:hypothetical protein